jgi:predicted negative regulator of RcsB-dependent stress response
VIWLDNMKKTLLTIVVIGLVGLITYQLFVYKQGYSSIKEEQYKKTVDSLVLEIEKKDVKIASLDSTRGILDSLLISDKAKLAELAKKAEQYRKKYDKERNRLHDMSDDDVISEFSKAFE